MSYPVAIHKNFYPRVKQLFDEQKRLSEAAQQVNLVLRELLTVAKEIQIEAGEIAPEAVIENIETGWTVIQQTGDQQAPVEADTGSAG